MAKVLSLVQDTVGKLDFTSMIQSVTTFDQQTQVAFLQLLAIVASKEFQNALSLKPYEKITFTNKLDTVVNQLEHVVGESKIITKPTDLDSQLTEVCANKDYNDTVRNAFSLLEDRLRSKLNVGREYFGNRLIDLALNPASGKIILGDIEAEREGIYLLFRGAFLFLRNPSSHTQILSEDRNAALKILHTFDFLLKLIDRATLRT